MTFPRGNLNTYALALDEESVLRSRAARDEFFNDPDAFEQDGAEIRPEILHSWRRSLDSGVDFRTMALPSIDVGGRAERLLRAASPIMQRLHEQLEGSDAWAMLLDRDCIQLSPAIGGDGVVPTTLERGSRPGALFRESVVGTNGAGTCVERLEPFAVVGPEHFRDSEVNLVSVGAPLRDALNRVVGVLSLNCHIDKANQLLMPFARDAAWAIRERLIDDAYGVERDLFAHFTQQSRRPSQAVIAVGANVFVANAAARQLIMHGLNSDAVAARVLDEVAGGQEREFTIDLEDGPITVRCRPVGLRDGSMAAMASLSRSATVGDSSEDVTHRGRAGFPTDAAAASLRRARANGLPALVVGERGSGKATLALGAMPEGWVAFDARSVGTDPELWIDSVRMACESAPAVLLRHLDELPSGLRTRLRDSIDSGKAWCVATAASAVPLDAPSALDDLFLVITERTALRERREELSRIVARVLADISPAHSLLRCSAEVLAVLSRHRWPGNITQLRRVLATSAMSAVGGEITIDSVPVSALAEAGSRDLTKLERLERELVLTGLRDASWNREEAAKALGISRATMYRKIKQFGISVPSSRS
ncbi:hypothetical protein DC31_16035 [Microbacterium sp. CH12i]|uniref:sigma-54-dependent Fis family transcriptional regulator n=1 Tax=Microbacterium sp. CH12i TaxID=1479651 RepID=UPI00046164E9|nr:helix-turn-helix domain-containing protein [Microbacterium sp. CH12i]KDA05461.1 hypothetical protein DC31_16035 [Microbacterium sp. CH12i]